MARGLELPLAREVAVQLMAHDALGAHARDELGIFEITRPRPLQAALASASSFACGAILPLLIAILSPPAFLPWSVITASLISLAILGALGARTGGVKILKPTLRILLWGSLSLGLTTLTGVLFGLKP